MSKEQVTTYGSSKTVNRIRNYISATHATGICFFYMIYWMGNFNHKEKCNYNELLNKCTVGATLSLITVLWSFSYNFLDGLYTLSMIFRDFKELQKKSLGTALLKSIFSFNMSMILHHAMVTVALYYMTTNKYHDIVFDVFAMVEFSNFSLYIVYEYLARGNPKDKVYLGLLILEALSFGILRLGFGFFKTVELYEMIGLFHILYLAASIIYIMSIVWTMKVCIQIWNYLMKHNKKN
ncbi:MAG: hypothetical protein Edafosvirus16_15 [Edafosvirus sp.]|uniref:TLC domain-containing protein n=1 Tax=Edafosvirus sp. TaxID=2487765 RepID=A0A3G4ZUD5_9VIRU|nr:MAG: hypothetical protein Edafosvirus16_15 [Edafosvirus sp.]